MSKRYHLPSQIIWHTEASSEDRERLGRVIIAAIRRAVESTAVTTGEIVATSSPEAPLDSRERFSPISYHADRSTYAVPSYDEGGAPVEVPVTARHHTGQRQHPGEPPIIEINFPGWVWFTYLDGHFLVRIQADWLAENVYHMSKEEAYRLYLENRRPAIDNPSLPVSYFIRELESRTGLQILPDFRRELELRGRLPLEEYGDFHYAIFLEEATLRRWFGPEQWSQYLHRPSGISGNTREGAHPINADWSVMKKNPELAKIYLLLMEHFTGLTVTTEINKMARNGLNSAELAIIIGKNPTRKVLTDLFTQGWREYLQAGGEGVNGFEPLIERIIEQYLRGNLHAIANRLKIGHGWPESNILGIIHRNNGLLLYDENGMPLPGLTGVGLRDEGYISFKPPEFLRGAAKVAREWDLTISESDALIFNLISQVYISDDIMVAQAAQAILENIKEVAQRVSHGLGAQVREAIGEVLPVLVIFMLGHATARFLMSRKNIIAVAIGLALEGSLRAAGYIMGLSFLGQTWEILMQAAFHMSRVQLDENGRPTRLSELHINMATRPIQKLIATLAVVMGTIALGAALRRIRAGRSRGTIEDPNSKLREDSVTDIEGIDPSTKVWVNTRTGRYHLPESRWYGKTVEGRYMTLAEAETAGYQRAFSQQASSGPPPSSGVYSVERPTLGNPRVVIRSWIGESQERAGLERDMMSAAAYCIEQIRDWQRSHSQGAGLGIESGEAIRLAPELVNQALQNRGIEAFLRTIRDQSEDTRLHLTTVTETHPGTLRLMDIHYIVETPEGGRMITLFEAAIEVQRSGRARAGVRLPGSDTYAWGPWVGSGATE